METTRTMLRSFITDNFLFGRSDQQLADDESLIENGIIDSTGVLQLVMFLEKECGVHVEDDEIIPDNLDSIDKLLHYTTRKLQGAAPRWEPAPAGHTSNSVAAGEEAATVA